MSGSQTTSGYKRGTTDETSTVTPTGIAGYQSDFANNYNKLFGQYQQLVKPTALMTAPLYSTVLDPIVQNTISKGIQGIKAQQATQGTQTANALGAAGTGNNSALLNVLNRQSQIGGAAAGNQLYATGLEQQRAQDIARQSMIAQINQNRLAARQMQIAALTQGGSLLDALTRMAAVARGESRKSHKKENIEYQETTDKSFI